MSSINGEETFLRLSSCYGLTDEDCDQQVSEAHLEMFSRSYCKQWKSLPPHLKLEIIVADDIDSSHEEPKTKRFKFFLKWKEIKGYSATYKIKCRQDAEKLCEMLKKSVHQAQLPTQTGKMHVYGIMKWKTVHKWQYLSIIKCVDCLLA